MRALCRNEREKLPLLHYSSLEFCAIGFEGGVQMFVRKVSALSEININFGI